VTTDRPRTDEPADPFGDEYSRFGGHVDESEEVTDCPECGGGRFDFWTTEGAVSGRFVCVECGAVPFDWNARSGVERGDRQ